jgi:hypothetical protein
MHELNAELSKKQSSGIEIYAELSKKQFNLIHNGDATIEVPYGVSMKNKAGSRALHFYCDDDDAAEELREGLNESGISWQ